MLYLNRLKNALDPRENQDQPVDLLTLSLDNFKNITKDFDDLFARLHSLNATEQLQAIWIYMAFTFYVRHWANDQGTHIEMPEKLKLIKELDKAIYHNIGDVLNRINHTSCDFFRNYPKHYHQKLLQINANLFAYAQMLKNDGISSEKILHNLPLKIKQEVLHISEERAQERENKGPSYTERNVNELLFQTLRHVPEPFQPLKKTVNDVYVDKATGLELDFPLKGNISIETDGIHHNTHGSMAHSVIHNFKAFAMREQGWTRVPVLANSSTNIIAARIADLLHYSPVADFFKQNQALVILFQNIQAEILSSQEIISHSMEDSKRDAYIEYLESLFNQMNTIRNFLKHRHLEVLLRSNAQIPQEVYRAKQAYEQTLFEVNNLKNELSRIELAETQQEAKMLAMNETQSRLQNEYNAFVNKIEQYSTNVTALREAINRYHRSKQTGEYEKNLTGYEKSFKENTEKLEAVTKHIDKLDLVKNDKQCELLMFMQKQNTEKTNYEKLLANKNQLKQKIDAKVAFAEKESLPMKAFFSNHLPTAEMSAITHHSQLTFNVTRSGLQVKLHNMAQQQKSFAEETEEKRRKLRNEVTHASKAIPEKLHHKESVQDRQDYRPTNLPSYSQQRKRSNTYYHDDRRDGERRNASSARATY